MSLGIDVDRVSEVLLADGWHDVKFFKGESSFELDAYEYIRKHEGRTDPDVRQGVPSTGATWFDVNHNAQIFCPVTSILAVMVKEQAQAQPVYSGGKTVIASADSPFTAGKLDDDAFLTKK